MENKKGLDFLLFYYFPLLIRKQMTKYFVNQIIQLSWSNKCFGMDVICRW